MPSTDLVIVESPAKARTIGRYLGAGYEVAASVGHVRDLPPRELGVDVDRGFEPTWVTIRGKGKVLDGLRAKARRADRILLATDPDREGEAIAYHVAERLGYDGRGDRFRRIQFREVTRSAVRQALDRPGDLDMRKVEAQQARRILDRLVGFRISPFLWKPLRPGLSAGRVQTVALRLICEREDEIRAFEPREYWSIKAHLEAKGEAFDARLHRIDGAKFTLETEAEARQVLEELEGVPFRVDRVDRRTRRKNPRPPFTTSTLQQEAAKRLRFSARKTMSLAQRLYEGVTVAGRGTTGLITYMRTDSTRVSAGAAGTARAWIREELGERYLSHSLRRWGGAQQRGAQEAHEAIRPTLPDLHPARVSASLSKDLAALYELIWLRFVAGQMAPAVYDTTAVDFDLEGRGSGRRYRFRATGAVVTFPGFTRLYREASEAGDRRQLDDLEPLPDLEAGDEAALKEMEPGQHFTRPPSRFSEASLVGELEAKGIGRPSTYAQIISTLQDREYVEVRRRRFEPTELGQVVARLLVRVFPDIFDVEFTSRMETRLDRVEGGEVEWRELLADFYPRLERRLEEGEATSERLVRELLVADGERCGACGAPMLVRWNKHGRFLGCSAYPECSSTRSLDAPDTPDGPLGIDPETGEPLYLKTGPYGPYIQRGEGDGDEAPKRVGLPEGRSVEEVDLAYARKLIALPRTLGTDPASGTEVVAGLGRYGPYVRRGKLYGDLSSETQLFEVELEEALAILAAKTKGRGQVLAELGTHEGTGRSIRVLDGRYGPYVTDGTLNASVPEGIDPRGLTMEDAVEILAERERRRGRRRRGRRGRGRGGRGRSGRGRRS
jgi:DNA topoisomerase-1